MQLFTNVKESLTEPFKQQVDTKELILWAILVAIVVWAAFDALRVLASWIGK